MQKYALLMLFPFAYLPLPGAISTWSGTISTDWGASGNWDTPPSFQNTARFSGDASATNQPDILGVAKTGIGVSFESAGWTINDSIGGVNFRIDGGDPLLSTSTNISSVGAGVNRIMPPITSTGSGAMHLHVGAGNTLQFSGAFNPAKTRVVSGGGTLVFDGPDNSISNNNLWTMVDNNTILANTRVSMGGNQTITQGTFGGTGSYAGYQYGTTTLGGTTILAPGGNGVFGAEIGALTLTCNSATIRHNWILDSGSTLQMQLGAGAGVSDQLIFSAYGGGKLTINPGAVLALSGGSITGGDYNIVMNAAADMTNIAGTFSTVFFNGTDVTGNPNYLLSYGTDNIVLSVTVPEPSTMALLLGFGALGLVVWRRKAA